ncbi:hypothetical protein ABZW30_38355 [Kitasatospora sp. NPDC004669]|uniref:hypothetical protein n=1 Tax=Kitasatospora sp. NPDC004669 TaxID=3154555 RepID=UPI0033BFB243
MAPTRRSRRPAARRLDVPEDRLTFPPAPPPTTPVRPVPVRPGPGMQGCCASTRIRRVLPGGAVAITRHHTPDCPIWSAR